MLAVLHLPGAPSYMTDTQKIAHIRDGVACQYEIAQRHAKLTIRGPVTRETIAQLGADIDRVLRSVQALSAAISLEKAAVELSLEQLNASPTLLSDAIRNLPIAVVVRPESMNLFRAHAWAAAQTGLLRAAFVDPLAASRWAEQTRMDYLLRRYCRTEEAA